MRNLRKFETEGAVFMTIKPNVVMVGDTGDILYNVDSSGVYIQQVDGSLYTTDKWTEAGFASELANGVAVISAEARFVISKTNASESTWITWLPNSSVDGVMLTSDLETAKSDYAGFENTSRMINSMSSVTSGAAYLCANYVFPNGQTGYLPALGEWMIVARYKGEVESALTLIDGSAIKDSWSSTQYSATEAWKFTRFFGTEHRTKNPSGATSTLPRAFTTLTL
ncbi:MAG: hypothetical protein IKT59_08980 [Bacteroidales bacterium]|nr:hypothetical protein [Bacteroidales bacterium]